MDKGYFDWLYFDQETISNSGLRICVETYNKVIAGQTRKLSETKALYKKTTGLDFTASRQHYVKVFSQSDFTIKIPLTKKGSLSFNKDLWPYLKDDTIRGIMSDMSEAKHFVSHYGKNFVGFMKHRDNKVFLHPKFHDGITYRLLTSRPALLNLPKVAGGIRECIIPNNDGDVIISADFSSQEYKILADISGDKKLIDSMNSGLDIHNYAKEATGMATRSIAKTFNFAIIYGAGDSTIAKQTGLSLSEVKDMRGKLAKVMPDVFSFRRRVKAFSGKFGYIINAYGRKIKTPEYKDYAGLNYFIQSTGADILRLSIKTMYKLYSDEMTKDGVQILLQEYDSLIVSVPEKLKEKWAGIIKETMINSYRPRNGLKMGVDIEYKYKNLLR